MPTRARADDAVDRRVDAAVDAEREPVTERVDRVDERVDLRRRETSRTMQHRAEHLALQPLEADRATISVGATNVPCAHAAGSARAVHGRRASACIAST